MLRIIALALLLMWLAGWGMHLGAFIHALLVIAIVVFVIDLLSGGRTTVA